MKHMYIYVCMYLGLPLWISWQRIRLQCRRPGFDPWLGRSLGEGKMTHSSILAWRIPCTAESMSQRVGRN